MLELKKGGPIPAMETNHLFYKIHKGKVTVQDYIDWSHGLLSKDISSLSVNILSSCSPHDNIFEIEFYFNRAVRELVMKQPTFEEAARAYISYLAAEIWKTNDHNRIYHLTDRIFKVACVEMSYPNDLMRWIELSELMDSVEYHNDPDVIQQIKNEAKELLRSK